MSGKTFRRSLIAHILNTTPGDEEPSDKAVARLYSALLLGSILLGLILCFAVG